MVGRTAGSSLPRASQALWQPHLQSDSDSVSDGVSNSDSDRDSDYDDDHDDNNCKSRDNSGRRGGEC